MVLHFVHPVDDDEIVSLGSNDSTTSTGSKLSRDSGFSAKRISLTRELQNLRRQMNKRMCCESELRFTQMEALGRSLEEERVVHVSKHEEQDDRIGELESFQKQLGLEQKVHSELIDCVTLKIKELAARINCLSRRGEIRDNEVMKLTQRFKETSAECNVKFDDSHTQCAEDRKICQNNNEGCSQLEELMQRFETQIAETNAKLSEFESEHALHTRKSKGQDDRIAELEFFQKQLGLQRKAQSEKIESELELNTCKIEEFAARIDSFSCKYEVRDNELMALAQRFKETSADCTVKFEDSNTRSAEDRKICQNNNKRCSQLEELMQRFEMQIAETTAKLSEFELEHALHTHRSEGHDDRIAELESFQKQLALEQKAHSELIDSDTLEIEQLAAQIDSLSWKGEVRDNELTKLAKLCKETSVECNVRFEDIHTRRAEDRKICQNNNERCSQLEELMQRFETQIVETNTKLSEFESEHALHTRKSEGQDDRIAELGCFQQQLGLERKAQSEQIESEHKSRRRGIEGLRAQINSLSRDNEICVNDLRELRQPFEQTSAKLNVKFDEVHMRHAEVFKICPKKTEWCTQLEELTLKLDQHSELVHTGAAPMNFETFGTTPLASDRKTCQELIEDGVKSHASAVQDLIAMFNARTEDLTSCLDAGYADREEK